MDVAAARRVPIVGYLDLERPEPRIVVSECTACGAYYFDRRMVCAACFADTFRARVVDPVGTLTTFTIVTSSRPGVPVPFVAGVIECGGISVRGNVVNVEPDADHVTLGMKVRLTTFPLGVDDNGVEAIGFGFEPAE